ncbi:hypothetical protein CHS0354_013782 [Potamilus streckersoni]|uniref:Uncharacterized protein n=1 Tax=Potamilus streckersoni TaxID=2493646 RepID=A0AAE0VVK7_9BIVA|nr:hypothetical protein CHS0354_013782 [Potamilus streckersoni]
MQSLRLLQGVLHTTLRRASSGKTLGVVPNKKAYKKLQKKQSEMCFQDGLLVWQKGSSYFEGLLRFLTYGMITVGTGIVLLRIYEMSCPAKKAD